MAKKQSTDLVPTTQANATSANATQALTTDIRNNLSVIKEDIVASKRENYIGGMTLKDFIYYQFLDRLDPIEYCQNVLRNHYPESKKYLHQNQVDLVRAACNPKLKQVAGLMARQTGKTESIASMSGYLIDNYPQMKVGIFTPRLQQAEVSIGRLSTFFQMNEERLNNKIVKLTKDKIELGNNSYVSAVSASDQSNIEGLTFDVMILDEAQKISNYTWSERIAPMGGACVVGTSRIQLLDGTTKTIEDIVREKKISALPCIDFETGRLTIGKITQYCDVGIRDTITITLENGYQIAGTYQHPVIALSTNNDIPHWERLDHITIDSKIAIPRVMPFFGNIHENKARILGMAINDTSLLNICEILNICESFDKESVCELLAGLFDTKGCFSQKAPNIVLNMNRSLLEQVRMLLTKIGVNATIAPPTYDLSISGAENIINFYKNIRVSQKKQQLETIYQHFATKQPSCSNDMLFYKVVDIRYTGPKHVYDLTIDKYHSYIANGIFVHNTNAKIIKIGTPKSKNHFYDSVEGKGSDKWTVIRRDWTECAQLWALDAIQLPDLATGQLRPYSRYVVEQLMPKALKQEYFPNNPEVWTEGGMDIEDFKTQYMLEFIDGAGKFLTTNQVKYLSDGDFDWLDHGNIGERYVAGIDFAGSNPEGDNTHITVLRITPDGIKQKVFGLEFKDETYPQQMYEISHLFGGYNPRFEVKKIFADYTGCGAAVVQTLQSEFGLTQLEGIIFNASDKFTHSGMNMKNLMYGKFRTELDSGKFKYLTKERFLASSLSSAGTNNIGFYHKMIGEWADLEYIVGKTLNKRIEAPAGYHDDVCDADVLANFAAIAGQRTSAPRVRYGRISRF